MNDVKAMDFIPYETSSYYVFDRAYNDFERLPRIDSMGGFFIIRTKTKKLYDKPCGRTLQESLAGGAVLQVAEAAPENQEVLGHVGKFREDSDPCSAIITYCLVAIVHHDMKLPPCTKFSRFWEFLFLC